MNSSDCEERTFWENELKNYQGIHVVLRKATSYGSSAVPKSPKGRRVGQHHTVFANGYYVFLKYYSVALCPTAYLEALG